MVGIFISSLKLENLSQTVKVWRRVVALMDFSIPPAAQPSVFNTAQKRKATRILTSKRSFGAPYNWYLALRLLATPKVTFCLFWFSSIFSEYCRREASREKITFKELIWASYTRCSHKLISAQIWISVFMCFLVECILVLFWICQWIGCDTAVKVASSLPVGIDGNRGNHNKRGGCHKRGGYHHIRALATHRQSNLRLTTTSGPEHGLSHRAHIKAAIIGIEIG